jgi:uncharacterized protein with HEPN domain
MSTRNDENLLTSISEGIDRINKYLLNCDIQNLKSDILLQDAVIRNFILIGESIKNISKLTKEEFPEIEFPQLVTISNCLISVFSGIDFKVIWDTAKNDLQKYNENIKKVIENLY